MGYEFRLTGYHTVVLDFDGFSLEIPVAEGTHQSGKAGADGTAPAGRQSVAPDTPQPKSSSANPTLGGGKKVGRPPLDPGIIGFVHKAGAELGANAASRSLASLTISDGADVDVTLSELLSASPQQVSKLTLRAQSRRGFSRARPIYLDVGVKSDKSEPLDILRDLGSLVMDSGNGIAGIRLIRDPRE